MKKAPYHTVSFNLSSFNIHTFKCPSSPPTHYDKQKMREEMRIFQRSQEFIITSRECEISESWCHLFYHHPNESSSTCELWYRGCRKIASQYFVAENVNVLSIEWIMWHDLINAHTTWHRVKLNNEKLYCHFFIFYVCISFM